MKVSGIIAVIVCVFFIWASPALAHQPRIVSDSEILVVNPETSKAYYGVLSGGAHVYTIDANESFKLYVGILVPDLASPKKDVTAEIRKGDTTLAVIGGKNATWKSFFEPFGQSTYWDGGDYKADVGPGTYKILVSSQNNDSKYSLAIGEEEKFDLKESLNALSLIPRLKRDFFRESPASFIFSPFGWGYILAIYLLSFIVGLFCWLLIWRYVKKGSSKRRTTSIMARTVCASIAVELLAWAIFTSWSPVLIFISGFALFVLSIGWNRFYDIGKHALTSINR